MYLSILIRNLNESKNLQQTLLALQKQVTDFEYEIIVVDNESDDDSAEVATKIGCKVFTLKRNAFTFGHALNYGISKCGGEIILILSSHLILLNEYFLNNIPGYFKDQKVAALRFVHAVSPENVVESFKNGPIQLNYENNATFADENWKNFIVNHCAALRRSCWQEVPFEEGNFASEDKIWSLAVMKKGYIILYNVPGFYVYTKPFSRTTKINRQIIEEAAKEMITGKTAPLLSVPYAVSLLKKIALGFRQISIDVKIHSRVYKGLKAFKQKHRDAFVRKEV
jgi:rhamnosyltransferase